MTNFLDQETPNAGTFNLIKIKKEKKKGTEVERMLEAGSKLPTRIAGSENNTRQ